jgi:predicted CoA-binding protein
MSVPATDDDLRRILTETRTIALVGWSPKPDRPSHRVAAFLKARGYRVIPVNPGQAGQEALGETVRASLSDIGEAVDMVDIFRRSEEAGAVVDEALAALPGLKTVWMQLGVVDEAAAARARAAGVEVVMDRCPAIEIPRLQM